VDVGAHVRQDPAAVAEGVLSAPLAVEIRAELRQIKSMADHTYNVVLNVPEDCLEQVQVMMAWLGDEIGVVAVNQTRTNGLDGGKTDGRTRRERQIRKG
jgi:hypothetical protein